jgi:5-methyltetrahydrofolate--homocysteine methyltransferase
MADKQKILGKITEAVLSLEAEDTRNSCEEALKAGIEVSEIVEAMAKGARILGEKYDQREIFLSELILAGECLKEGLKVIEPQLKASQVKRVGKIVLGTVKGDIHEIGKNIVGMMLTSAGFEVVDLGVDVPPEKFAEAVEQEKPNILGLSCLLSTSLPQIEETIKIMVERGIRGKVKIIVGGNPVTDEYAEKIGADGYGENAVEAVKVCRRLLGLAEKG